MMLCFHEAALRYLCPNGPISMEKTLLFITNPWSLHHLCSPAQFQGVFSFLLIWVYIIGIPLYPWEMHSKNPSGWLKPQIAPNTHTLFLREKMRLNWGPVVLLVLWLQCDQKWRQSRKNQLELLPALSRKLTGRARKEQETRPKSLGYSVTFLSGKSQFWRVGGWSELGSKYNNPLSRFYFIVKKQMT